MYLSVAQDYSLCEINFLTLFNYYLDLILMERNGRQLWHGGCGLCLQGYYLKRRLGLISAWGWKKQSNAGWPLLFHHNLFLTLYWVIWSIVFYIFNFTIQFPKCTYNNIRLTVTIIIYFFISWNVDTKL